MFVIPLRDWISCGYVFNPRISSDADVAADHTAFLHEQGVVAWEQRVAPSFPNFIRRKMFDGRVFWTGNAALFIEPLEATTIGHAIVQVRWATRWIKEAGLGRRAEPDESRCLQQHHGDSRLPRLAVRRLALCVRLTLGHAVLAIRPGRHRTRPQQSGAPAPIWPRWSNLSLPAGPCPASQLSACEDQDQWEREVLPLLRLYRPFGNFSELNFAQVGHGIGYYRTA